MGRNNAAAGDFSKILDLKPDFEKALMQRARIYAKEGDFELAKKDLETYIKSHPKDTEAASLVRIFFYYYYTLYKSKKENSKLLFDLAIYN